MWLFTHFKNAANANANSTLLRRKQPVSVAEVSTGRDGSVKLSK